MQLINTLRSLQIRFMVSRMILLLTILVIIVMPVTEHFWTWDNFSGGQDFEFSLLAVLLFCGLLALIAHQVVIVAPILLLLLVHQLKAPPRRRLIDLAASVAAGMAMHRSIKDRSPGSASLFAIPLRI